MRIIRSLAMTLLAGWWGMAAEAAQTAPHDVFAFVRALDAAAELRASLPGAEVLVDGLTMRIILPKR